MDRPPGAPLKPPAALVFLVGFMAAGKSTFGQRLALHLDWPFFDLDALITAQTGQQIPDLFAEKGEAWFRAAETRMLREFVEARPAPLILATGGGAPVFHGNMAWMNQAGKTVFLNPPWEIILQRLAEGRLSRPLLAQNPNWANQAALTFHQRLPVYAQAHFTLSTAPPDLEALLAWLKG